jgi:hypothetical protein
MSIAVETPPVSDGGAIGVLLHAVVEQRAHVRVF